MLTPFKLYLSVTRNILKIVSSATPILKMVHLILEKIEELGQDQIGHLELWRESPCCTIIVTVKLKILLVVIGILTLTLTDS